MADLFFPQLGTGAMAQYPLKKTSYFRTIQNVLADGSVIADADPASQLRRWELLYQGLSAEETAALSTHFETCSGSFRAFTFIDPTDNMLNASSDFSGSSWQLDGGLQIMAGVEDPEGGKSAFLVTNKAQVTQDISQQFTVPAGFEYCLSIYAASVQPASLMLFRRGVAASAVDSVQLDSNWARCISSGQLVDNGTTFTAGIRLNPGQQVTIFGPQLEPQLAPSRYRATSQSGGVYSKAHWATNSLIIASDGPNIFSTSVSIEAAT